MTRERKGTVIVILKLSHSNVSQCAGCWGLITSSSQPEKMSVKKAGDMSAKPLTTKPNAVFCFFICLSKVLKSCLYLLLFTVTKLKIPLTTHQN